MAGLQCAMRIGPYDIAPNVILAPMAGVTDKPFRLLCKRLGAGLAVSEMTTSDPRFWNTVEIPAPHGPRRRTRPGQRADRRHRARSHGRRRALQRRPRRTDHRHQHGLPGEEGLQRLGRLGADARRSPGRAHPRGGGRRGRRAGDAEDPHRLGRRPPQWAGDRAHRRGRRHRRAGRAWPHPRPAIHRRRRVRHHRRDQVALRSR